MSNVGAKIVRDMHKALNKLTNSPIQTESEIAITSAPRMTEIHHLPCSISRMVIPTSMAQYRGFFMLIDLLVCCVTRRGKIACESLKIPKSASLQVPGPPV